MSEQQAITIDDLPGFATNELPNNHINATEEAREIASDYLATPAVINDAFVTRLFPSGAVNFKQICISSNGVIRLLEKRDLENNSYQNLRNLFTFIDENDSAAIHRIPDAREA